MNAQFGGGKSGLTIAVFLLQNHSASLEGWDMSKPWLNVLLTTGVLFLTAALTAPPCGQARAETPQTPTIADKTARAQERPGRPIRMRGRRQRRGCIFW